MKPLRSYAANEQQFLSAVQEGKDALRDGRVLDHNTVVAALIGLPRLGHDAATLDDTSSRRLSRYCSLDKRQEPRSCGAGR
jgi:hypothetical protein